MDVKLAHSIANAVDTDAQAIAQITAVEAQAMEDRGVALRMSKDDPDLEAPPPYTEDIRNEYLEDEVLRRLKLLLLSDETSYDDNESEAGPSVPYTQRQAEALGKLSRQNFECCACREDFRLAEVTVLDCEHQYCGACLKRVIMRAAVEKDLAYLPPRCCGTALPYTLITKSLNEEEMEDFRNAEEEKATRNKTYCTNPDCGRFIAPRYIRAGEATCPRCKAQTCAMCKNRFHENDCPADPDLQATLRLGEAQQWQRCFSCRALVEIDMGCNHMT
jgi:hypothetical protein